MTVLASLHQVRQLVGAEVIAEHPRSYGKGEQIEESAYFEALFELKPRGGTRSRQIVAVLLQQQHSYKFAL